MDGWIYIAIILFPLENISYYKNVELKESSPFDKRAITENLLKM